MRRRVISLVPIFMLGFVGCGDGGTSIPPNYIPSFSTAVNSGTALSKGTVVVNTRALALKDTATEPTGSAKLSFGIAKGFLDRGSELDRAICTLNAAKVTGVSPTLFDGTTRVFSVDGEFRVQAQISGDPAVSDAKIWVCSVVPVLSQSGYAEGHFAGPTPELVGKVIRSNGSDSGKLRIYGTVDGSGIWTEKKIEMTLDGLTLDAYLNGQQYSGYMLLKAIRTDASMYGAVSLAGNAYLTSAEVNSKNAQVPLPNPTYSGYRIGQGSAIFGGGDTVVHWDDNLASTITPSALSSMLVNPGVFSSSELSSQMGQVPLTGFETWDCSATNVIDLSTFTSDSTKLAPTGTRVYGRDVSGQSFGSILTKVCL